MAEPHDTRFQRRLLEGFQTTDNSLYDSELLSTPSEAILSASSGQEFSTAVAEQSAARSDVFRSPVITPLQAGVEKVSRQRRPMSSRQLSSDHTPDPTATNVNAADGLRRPSFFEKLAAGGEERQALLRELAREILAEDPAYVAARASRLAAGAAVPEPTGNAAYSDALPAVAEDPSVLRPPPSFATLGVSAAGPAIRQMSQPVQARLSPLVGVPPPAPTAASSGAALRPDDTGAGVSDDHLRAAQAAAVAATSAVLSQDPILASVSNQNIERLAPGVSAAARGFLQGSSAAVASGAVASASLPGDSGGFQQAGFGEVEGVNQLGLGRACYGVAGRGIVVQQQLSLPNFSTVAAEAHVGEFGMLRGTQAFYPENFVVGSGSTSVSVHTFVDNFSGEQVTRPSDTRHASDSRLMMLFSSFPAFDVAHTYMLSAAVKQGFIRSEELEGYKVYMRKLLKAHNMLVSIKGLSDGLLRFIKFDRLCRTNQFNFGYSWSVAFEELEFFRVYLEAELVVFKQLLSVAAKLPPKVSASGGGGQGSSARGGSASRVQKMGHCFGFWDHGHCNLADCHYASSHKCMKCGSVEHGTSQCKGAGSSTNSWSLWSPCLLQSLACQSFLSQVVGGLLLGQSHLSYSCWWIMLLVLLGLQVFLVFHCGTWWVLLEVGIGCLRSQIVR